MSTSKHKKEPKKYKKATNRSFVKLKPVLFVIAFATIATIIIVTSSASTAVITLESETMTLPSGASIINDSSASNSQAVKFSATGSAVKTFNLSSATDSVNVRAKGAVCKGSPEFDLTIDGALVTTQSVSSTTWTDYNIPKALTAGSHSVAVAFPNYSSWKNCKLALYIDKLAFTVTNVIPAYTYKILSDPARTEAYDSQGRLVAKFTNSARTVVLIGPSRTFAEPAYTAATVTTTNWVRVLSTPFNGTVDEAWLTKELSDSSADIFQISMQYIDQATTIYETSGLKYAGDADYGPLQTDGTRQEGSDFNDYLGLPWTYGTTIDQPEVNQIGSLDCSGFQRMVWGYRSGIPLTLSPNGTAIPRRSFEILNSAPGIVTMSNNGTQITDLSKLQPGDLVFQDADTSDGTQIDHMGLYLGLDNNGSYRFISSRKKVNGPTMGDYYGKSILDGTGLYATSFRAIRRL